MARHAHEFQCDGAQKGRPPSDPPYKKDDNCGYYNYPVLDDSMSGNYVIVCGNCGHEHYRVIKNGVVTDDRLDDRLGKAERIHVMKSATQKEKRKLGLVAQLRQAEAAGLNK